ncbi:MAG: hypothetical protein P8R02_03490 [Pseudomonadales bacterium]|nr:hypothetical protein [Pseudomonadales bacterium]
MSRPIIPGVTRALKESASGSIKGLAFCLFFPGNDYWQGLVRSIGALLEIDDLPVSPFSTSGKKFQLA